MTYSEEQILEDVAGAADVIAWFGRWPSFHDGEVVSLWLNREAASVLKIHVFNTSSELTKSGHYKTGKHALVVFQLTNILAMDLVDFNSQNVISALMLSKTDDGFLIKLGCCYGLCGSIRAESIRVAVEPGMPAGSIYTSTVDT